MKNINISAIPKNKNIKIILMITVLLLAIIPLWYKTREKPIEKKQIKTKEKEYTTFAHTEPDIIKEEIYKGLKFTNISLMTEKGYTTLTATVTNTTETVSDIKTVYIDLIDKEEKVIISLKGSIKTKLKSNESTIITTKARGEFKNIVSKKIRE